MSVEQLQQRLSDLRFSLEEQIKAFKAEQDESEKAYEEWENEGEGLEGDEKDDHENEPPDVIDNDARINACEAAKDKIDEAIEALDDAMGD